MTEHAGLLPGAFDLVSRGMAGWTRLADAVARSLGTTPQEI